MMVHGCGTVNPAGRRGRYQKSGNGSVFVAFADFYPKCGAGTRGQWLPGLGSRYPWAVATRTREQVPVGRG